MRSNNPRRVLMLLAVIAAAIHLWNLLPSPASATNAVMSDLIEKGTALSEAQQSEMRSGMYAMFMFNRVVDSVLATLALVVAFALYRARTVIAALAAGAYAVINICFLYFSWGMYEHGVYAIAKSMGSRLGYGFQHQSVLAAAEQLGRLFTFLLAVVFVVAVCDFLIRRKPESSGRA